MPQYFERPDQKTFKALKFNGQIFAIGRGLFIHLMKYYPQDVQDLIRTSRSKVEFNLENFVKTVRGQKTHFKSLRLEYVDIDKSYREEIKLLSKVGEGWWPERKVLPKPGLDYDLTFSNFLMNYEGDRFHRRLGRGMNIPNTERTKYQSGVEFTRIGLRKAILAYRTLTGKDQLFGLELPSDQFGWYWMKQLSALSPIPTFEPAVWTIYKIKNKKDREAWIDANREVCEQFTGRSSN